MKTKNLSGTQRNGKHGKELHMESVGAKKDPRADSFAHAGFLERLIIIYRAILSYVVLIIFLFVPTMWLKKKYALAVARLPEFKKFEFFRSMFKVIDEDKKLRGRK